MYNKNKFLAAAILVAPVTAVMWIILSGTGWSFHQPIASGAFNTGTFNSGTLALVLLVVPICEEVVFRGLLQHELASYAKLRRTVLGISWDNIISSGLFTLVHVIYFENLWVLLLIIPALLLGLFYSRQRRLIYPVCLHIWYNANGLLVCALL